MILKSLCKNKPLSSIHIHLSKNAGKFSNFEYLNSMVIVFYVNIVNVNIAHLCFARKIALPQFSISVLICRLLPAITEKWFL